MSQRERRFPRRVLVTLSVALAAMAVGAAPAQASHTVSCRADLPVRPGEAMTWRAIVSGGSGSYGYAWSGSGGLGGTTQVVTNTYESIGYKLADVSVTDRLAGETAGASCQMHVIPASFSEPPHVVPVLWVPRDVDPAPMLEQLERAWRSVRAHFFHAYGRTFRTGELQVVVSTQTEAEICGGDCTDLGKADPLMFHAIAEAGDRLGGPVAYTRALHVMAWGAGGWAGSWGWEGRGGVGDVAIAPAAGVMDPAVEPDMHRSLAESLGLYEGMGVYTIAHELNHTIAWDDPHDFALEVPPNDYEVAVSRAGPYLTETLADPVPPAVELSQPTDGASVSGTVDIPVEASDEVAMDAVVLTVDGQFWGVDESAPYSLEVDTTRLGFGRHRIEAIAYDAEGNTAKAARTVHVDNRVAEQSCGEDFPPGTFKACFYEGIGFDGPYLGTLIDHPFPVTAPNSGWGLNHRWGDDMIAFGRADNLTGVWRGTLDFPPANYILQFVAFDGLRVYVDGELVIDEWRDGVGEQETVVALDGPTRIRIEWFDSAFGAMLTFHWRPTRRPATTGAPTVTGVSPAEAATGVARNTNVSVTFSEPMDEAATQAAFSLTRAGTTTPVAGSFSWSGTTLTFDPAQDLAGGAAYTARVSTGARDAGGTGLATEKTWQFTTVRHVIAFPTSVFIWLGTHRSGDVSRLRSNDDRFYQVNSTTSGTRTTSWYGKFENVPNSLSSLRLVYRGRNSTTCRQTLSLWHWPTGSWVEVDARNVGTSEVAVVREAIPSPAHYVSGDSGGGDVRLKVRCTHGSQSFYASADEMRIGFDVP